MTSRTKWEIAMCVFWTVAAVGFFLFSDPVVALVFACVLPFRYAAAAFIINEEVNQHD